MTTTAVRLAALAMLAITSVFPLPAPMAATTSAASSTAAEAQGIDHPELRAKLKRNLPDLEIMAIHETELPGIFALVLNRTGVVYTDAEGKYVLNGHLFDAASKKDLTEALLASYDHIDPNALPLADSFAEVRGDGKRQLYVFSDPDCPFCKRLEPELQKLDNVTIHVFLFPLESIHPHSTVHAIGIWCAADRNQAWAADMLKNESPAAGTCDNPVERNLALGRRLGLLATPTLILGDGRLVTGALPVDKLEQLLSGVH